MILDAFHLTDQVAIVTGADVVVAARTACDLADTVRLIEQTGRRGLAVVNVMLRVDGGITRPAFDLPAPPLQPAHQQETP